MNAVWFKFQPSSHLQAVIPEEGGTTRAPTTSEISQGIQRLKYILYKKKKAQTITVQGTQNLRFRFLLLSALLR